MDFKVKHSLYPFESHFLAHNGLRYHYLDEGSEHNQTIIMLHGNPTWSFYYRELIKALRADYRCIVPDHIGCGFSDKPTDNHYAYTLEQRIDDLDALLEYLDIRDEITLVVHDWGGAIGFGYAIRYPERIKRLVILNTAAFHLPQGKKVPLVLKLVRNTRIAAFFVLRFNAFARGAAWVACTRKRMSPALRRAYCAPYHSPETRVATLRFVQDIPLSPGDSAYAALSEIQAGLKKFNHLPILICWGMKDFVFDHHFLREFQQYFPHASVQEFPRSGHYILEDAGEEIIPLIQSFLEQTSV